MRGSTLSFLRAILLKSKELRYKKHRLRYKKHVYFVLDKTNLKCKRHKIVVINLGPSLLHS